MINQYVKITVRGSLMWVSPATPIVRSVVEEATTYSLLVQTQGGTQRKYEKRCLSQYSPSNNLIETLSGLRHRVQTALEKVGYTVEVKRFDIHKLEPDLLKLTAEDAVDFSNRSDQVNVIGLVCDHPEGFIVQAPTGWGKSYLIGQLCKVLPQYRIAIVAPGKEISLDLYKNLRRRIREVGMVGAGNKTVSRITVSTMDSLQKLQGYEWDLLLFDEAHRAGAVNVTNNICSIFPNTKCVGFSASPTGRTDGADLVVEALFGPIAYTVSYDDAVDRGVVVPIEVRMYRLDKGPNVPAERTVTLNRNCLWRNRSRNEFIAKLARQVPEDEQVLITVATAEHALFLRQMLPEFEVVFSNITNKNMLRWLAEGKFEKVVGLYKGQLLDGRRNRLKRDFENGELKRAIATGVWATGVNFRKLQWLIRADGMASAIQATQTPGRLSRTSLGKERGVLIDFVDAFQPALMRRSQQRMKNYKDKGWDVDVLYDPDMSIETFSRLKKE